LLREGLNWWNKIRKWYFMGLSKSI